MKKKDDYWRTEMNCPDCGGPTIMLRALSGPPAYIRKHKYLNEIQKEIKEWSDKNFGHKDKIGRRIKRKSWHPLLGIGEELGELQHAYLKKEQKIRDGEKLYKKDAQDALGDMLIYMMDFCALENFDLQEIIDKTWEEVKKRDWKKNPKKGK